jgi:hypothetical protein
MKSETAKQPGNSSRVRLIVILAIAGCIAGIVLAYIFQWDWTGFMESTGPDVLQYQSTKTLWDWLQLLVIPGVFLFIAYRFNLAANRTKDENARMRMHMEQELASDIQNEALLQGYLDKMSELLLDNKLQHEQPNVGARTIARARTLTVLYRLDPDRKGSLIRFLYESGLLNQDECIIDLSQADLSQVNLSSVNLSGIDLSNTNMTGAQLSDTELSNANLTNVNLLESKCVNANLREALLKGADLSSCDLSGANLTSAKMFQCKLLGARLNGARLGEADLTESDLRDANLYRTVLKQANLSQARLDNAMLDHADLTDARCSTSQLKKARSIHGIVGMNIP